MSRSPWWRRLRLLWPLDPPTDLPSGEDPSRDWPSRAMEAARARWRPWMVVPVLLLVVGAAAIIPVPMTVEQPAVIVDARTLAEVVVEDPGPGRQPGYTGAYLQPRTRTSRTALGWAVALLWPGRSPGPTETSRTATGFPPLEVALLVGAGVAPGRGDPTALGLAATTTAPDIPEDQLGLLLHIADSVHRRDLAGGRRILALGAVTPTSTVRCSADPPASVAATTPPPDLVVIGNGCADDLDRTGGVPVVEVASLTEALVAVGSRDRSR